MLWKGKLTARPEIFFSIVDPHPILAVMQFGLAFCVKNPYFWIMSTMTIDILNPKAEKLIKDLADLNLISIQKSSKNNFTHVLRKLRSKAKSAPPLDEIAKEVESVRARRYEK